MSQSNQVGMHYVFDPFQVYCFRRRPEMVKSNSQLKNSAITSLIAAEWRQLPSYEKQYYVDIANSLINNVKKTKPKRKKIHVMFEESPEMIESPDVNIDSQNDFSIPLISVVRRHNFGKDIEQISKDLILKEEHWFYLFFSFFCYYFNHVFYFYAFHYV